MKKTERKVSIEYGGETFESYKGLAEKLNVSVNNLRYKIQNGFPKNEWGIEKKINPFLRADDNNFMQSVGLSGKNASESFGKIRLKKDNF